MDGNIQVPLWWFLVLLEVLLVLLAWQAWQFWKRRGARSHDGDEVTEAGVEHWLRSQIEATERRRDAGRQHQGDIVPVPLLERRLAWLRVELESRQAARAPGRDFWHEFTRRAARLVPHRRLESELARERQRAARLSEQLQAARQRIDNLEKFRELFFETKERLENSRSLNTRLRDAVERLPDAQRPRELSSLLTHLEEENRRLSAEMAEVEETLDRMLRAGPDLEPSDLSQENFSALSSSMGQRLLVLRRNYARQAELIRELQAQLQEATGLDGTRPFREILEELEQARLTLKEQVVRLEEENEFLARQISMLLRQELETEQAHAQERALLEERLAHKEAQLAETEKKLAELERQFLALHGARERRG